MPPKNISVLVLPVTPCPELQTFRKAEMIKPTAILGPHVSMLGPFDPAEITDPMIDHIAEIAGSFPAIDCLFSQFGVFPDVPVLHMSAYPAGPFERFLDALLPAFPGHRPAFRGPVYHMSLAFGFPLGELPNVLARAHAQLDPHMPIETTLDELHLTDRIDGVWVTRKVFPLKSKAK